MNVNFRKEWFNWVAKERKRMQRKVRENGEPPGCHGAGLCELAKTEGETQEAGRPCGQKRSKSRVQFESCPDKGRCNSID